MLKGERKEGINKKQTKRVLIVSFVINNKKRSIFVINLVRWKVILDNKEEDNDFLFIYLS